MGQFACSGSDCGFIDALNQEPLFKNRSQSESRAGFDRLREWLDIEIFTSKLVNFEKMASSRCDPVLCQMQSLAPNA